MDFTTEKNINLAKEVLYFSDGVMEVADDKGLSQNDAQAVQTMNYKQMDWAQWTLHMATLAGSKTLQGCDYLGEGLASFFGITTPKYQYEINEYFRMKKSEEEEQRVKDLEMGTWTQENADNTHTVETPPSAGSDRAHASISPPSTALNNATEKY